MGNDGGTIPTRREILNLDNSSLKPQESQKLINNSNNEILWQYCKLSLNKLQNEQVVSDYLGYLYNKESVIEYLIKIKRDPSKVNPKFSHLKSINDIVTLKDFDKITNFNDQYCYLVPCGDIIKLKLINELLKSNKDDFIQCPICNLNTNKRDIIEINSNKERELTERINSLNKELLYHNLQKIKQKKRKLNDEKTKTKKKKVVPVIIREDNTEDTRYHTR